MRKANKKPTVPLVSGPIVEVLRQAAESIGATLLIEPEWQCVGQITYLSGVRRYFRLSTLDLNTMGASEIARDKGYSRFFLRHMNYPVPTGNTFLSPEWSKKLGAPDRGGILNAWSYAKSIGLPVFVKPNSLSRGIGVAKAHNWTEFHRAASEAMKCDKVIIVERAVVGQDYRLVVLDGEVISAYERVALTIVGDGISTITDLLTKRQEDFTRHGRETVIDCNDYRLEANLRRNSLTLDSIPKAGNIIELLDIANLSAGGTSLDVTNRLHPTFRELARSIARDMGLRLVGVDLIVHGDIDAEPTEGHYWIIEINSAPGLDHYASMGDIQKRLVDDLYLRVIKAMERPHEEIYRSDAIRQGHQEPADCDKVT